MATVTPEFELFVKESRLGTAEAFLYHLFPTRAQKFLARIFPGSVTISRVLEVTDFRTQHGFPAGYIPPRLQYQSPSSKQLP